MLFPPSFPLSHINRRTIQKQGPRETVLLSKCSSSSFFLIGTGSLDNEEEKPATYFFVNRGNCAELAVGVQSPCCAATGGHWLLFWVETCSTLESFTRIFRQQPAIAPTVWTGGW